MDSASRILFLACMAGCAGCSSLDPRPDQADMQRRLAADTEERKARLKAKGTLSPQEYDLLAKKMGWTTSPAGGLPSPPTVEELEQRVKAAETSKP
ncbi:MAG: hypothetical protein ACKO8X_04585 [Verrucomicrobiota bacterium]